MAEPHRKPPFRLFSPWDRVPELQQFAPMMRYEIWERANAAGRLGCVVSIIICLWIAFVLDGYHLLDGGSYRMTAFEQFMDNNGGLILFVSFVLAFFVLIPLQRYYGRRKVRAWLVNSQMYSRAPACLACGYALLGTPEESTECPECGRPIPRGKTPQSLPR